MPGLFARHQVDDLGLETALLAPAQVHAQQHLRPVLRFGAASAGVDGDDGVAVVVRAGERQLELKVRRTVSRVACGFALDVGRRVASSDSDVGELDQIEEVADARFETAPGGDAYARTDESGASLLARTAGRSRSRVRRTAPRAKRPQPLAPGCQRRTIT